MGWNDRLMVGPGYQDLYDSPEEANRSYHAAAERAHLIASVGGSQLAAIRAEIAEINASYAGRETFNCCCCGQEFPMSQRVLHACRFCAEVKYS